MKISSFLGAGSTKASIIELLSEKWPLTARKIYFRLTKNYSLQITYQATHKALKELTDTNILEKTKQGYLLNKEWVKKLGDFSEKLSLDLESASQRKEIKTFHKLTFNNHREFIKFHLEFIEKIIKKEKKLEMIFHYRHIPYPHVLSNEEIEIMKKLMPKLKWSIFSKKDTPVGRWCAKQWNKIGVKTKMGVDIPSDRTMILNDYIVKVYTSKKSIEMWDKAYNVKSIVNFDVNSTIENVSNSKHKTVMTIMKDKEISSLLRSFGN